ncbi:MAG: hypothetical protein ACFWT2_06060 [Thermoanaerobacterium thermosaccharolyticum]
MEQSTEKISVCINNSENNTESKLFKKDSTEKYSVLQKIRNGVEGIPSILRRKYHVDVIQGDYALFSFKIGAINKKSTKNGSGDGSLYKNIEINLFLQKQVKSKQSCY